MTCRQQNRFYLKQLFTSQLLKLCNIKRSARQNNITRVLSRSENKQSRTRLINYYRNEVKGKTQDENERKYFHIILCDLKEKKIFISSCREELDSKRFAIAIFRAGEETRGSRFDVHKREKPTDS